MAGPGALPFDPIEEARRHWDEHGWGGAAPGMALVTSVMRVHQILLARVEDVLRPFDLTFSRYEVLMLLLFTRTGQLPLGKIGERLQVHAASVTNAIDRLESTRLVRRVPNPADGRGTLARLTPEGRTVARRATRALNESVFAPLEGEMGDSGRLADLTGLLGRLRRQAGDFR